jgi:phage major head subunit gpT-like protein
MYRKSAGVLHCRSIELAPDSWDDETRTVRAVFATDVPAVSIDSRTGEGVLEVWHMDGAEYDDRAPLCDTHNRSTVKAVLGSILPEGVEDREGGGRQLVGRIQISEAEPKIATKVREGHIRSVSGGVQTLECEIVPKGQTRSIKGASFTAPSDRDLSVVTRWRLREVSLVPIGADPNAKIRSEGTTMKASTRKYLQSLGLRSDATDDQAIKFLEALPAETRALAERAEEGETEEQRKKREDAEKEKDKEKKARAEADEKEEAERKKREEEDKGGERKKSAPVTESVRAEIAATERKRVAEIRRLGDGQSDETVRKAIEEDWTVERASRAFLETIRDRTDPAGPAIHSRGHDKDCTAAAMGMGLALRNCDGEKLLKYGASYAPAKGQPGGIGSEYRLRRAVDRDTFRKTLERMLNDGDQYQSMSLHDICREACRLDGKPVSLHLSVEETFRTAMSGSALANIFTTNINAEFLTGYMDYSDSTVGWVSESDKNNFLTNEVATMGKFGRLKKATRGRPAEHLDTSDSKESYKLVRYAGQFVVDEQSIIDDRFGAIEAESPRDMGLTAAQLRPNLVYGIVLENGVLDVDGVALFDSATHANYAAGASGAGGPLAVDSLQAAIVAMGKQRIGGRVLNIKPRFLIVPQDAKFDAGILLKSAERVIASASGGTYNPLKELEINLVVDDRVGVGGVIDPRTDAARVGTATNFFLAARPGEEGAKTIEVGYRRGTGRAPVIRSFILDKGQWGMGWDINMDIGAKALDFRAMYKAKGAA